jgi:hypothetical protein
MNIEGNTDRNVNFFKPSYDRLERSANIKTLLPGIREAAMASKRRQNQPDV